MDLRSYFKNTSKLSSKEQPSHSSCEEGNVPQAKIICSSSTGDAGPSKELEGNSVVIRGSTKKGGRRNLLGWSMMLTQMEHSVNCERNLVDLLNVQGVLG